MQIKEKSFFILVLLTLTVLLLAACSSESDSSNKKTVLTVATDSDTAPFTYKEDNEFRGYDIEVIEAIFENSEDYEVEFVTTAFDSILVGIDSDRYQIAANDFNYNEERAEKYLFSEPISKSNYAVTSASGIFYSSLDDLAGKSTEVLAGSNYAQVLEEWNAANADKEEIVINYVASSTGLATRMQHLENGTIDFILYDAISSAYIVEDQGFNLTVTNVTEELGNTTDGLEYLLFAKTDEGEEIQACVNQRITELKADGTLAALSEKYFGGDYVSSLD